MRIRKRRPVERANSHASTAVRRLPICRSADGLGANLPARLLGRLRRPKSTQLVPVPGGRLAHLLVVLGEVALHAVDIALRASRHRRVSPA